MRTEFSLLRNGLAGRCEHANGHQGSIKDWEFVVSQPYKIADK
jgi:hypothetical protein